MDDVRNRLDKIWQGIADQACEVNKQLDLSIKQQETITELERTRLTLLKQLVERIEAGKT